MTFATTSRALPVSKMPAAKPNAQAVEYAQHIVRRTQASALFKDAPMAISKGGLTGNRSVDRALLQFQNFALNRWSIWRHDIARVGIKDKNFTRAFNKFLWLAMATTMEEGIRRGSREIINVLTGREDKEDEAFWKEVLKGALNDVPFLGQVLSVANYGRNPVPALEAPLRGLEAGKSLVAGKKPETRLRGAIGVGEALGKAVGVPGSGQLAELLKGRIKDRKKSAMDWLTGGSQSATDWLTSSSGRNFLAQ